MSKFKIPSIVLSFDRNRIFAENMVLSYQELWPGHPLHFHLPYQEDLALDSRIDSSTVSFVRTKPGIRETVLALLDAFEDDALIFWCIDDKFPTQIAADTLNAVFTSLESIDADFQALLFTRARSLISFPGIDHTETEILGNPAYRVLTNNQFWLHQLVRVRRLREFFEALPEISRAKDMDTYVRDLRKPDSVFVLKKTALILNESTSRGAPTRAALGSLRQNRLLVPDHIGSESIEIRPIGELLVRERVRKTWHDLSSSARRHRSV